MKKKILFLGDSITDVGRNTDSGSTESIGQGYVLMVSGEMQFRFPGSFDCINRGISGNRIVDLYARIKADCWNLTPDIISILIGVNDVWHDLSTQNGVEADRYENIYRLLLRETLFRNQDTRFILLEPFVLENSSIDTDWPLFRSEVEKRAEITKQLSEEFHAIFVPLQKHFDNALKQADSSYWLKDGIHPTPAGHRLIADEWLKGVFTYTPAGIDLQPPVS